MMSTRWKRVIRVAFNIDMSTSLWCSQDERESSMLLSISIWVLVYDVHKMKESHPCCFRYRSVINEMSNTKFLVVLWRTKNWKKHIDDIAGKLSRGIRLVAKAQKLLNLEELITQYPFIYSYLCYCNHLWGDIAVTHLTVMQELIGGMIMGLAYSILTSRVMRVHISH